MRHGFGGGAARTRPIYNTHARLITLSAHIIGRPCNGCGIIIPRLVRVVGPGARRTLITPVALLPVTSSALVRKFPLPFSLHPLTLNTHIHTQDGKVEKLVISRGWALLPKHTLYTTGCIVGKVRSVRQIATKRPIRLELEPLLWMVRFLNYIFVKYAMSISIIETNIKKYRYKSLKTVSYVYHVIILKTILP